MNYYYSKEIEMPFNDVRQLVEERLKESGFGIVSEIDIHDKFKEKLGIEFRKYKILGACSPKYAFEAISNEEHIGLMLPCNVVLQEKAANRIEVSVIDPIASMQAVENESLGKTAEEIRKKLMEFIDGL